MDDFEASHILYIYLHVRDTMMELLINCGRMIFIPGREQCYKPGTLSLEPDVEYFPAHFHSLPAPQIQFNRMEITSSDVGRFCLIIYCINQWHEGSMAWWRTRFLLQLLGRGHPEASGRVQSRERESSKQNMASRLGLARRNSSRGKNRGVKEEDKERTKRGRSQNSRVIRRVRSWKFAVEGGEKSWDLRSWGSTQTREHFGMLIGTTFVPSVRGEGRAPLLEENWLLSRNQNWGKRNFVWTGHKLRSHLHLWTKHEDWGKAMLASTVEAGQRPT